MKKLLNTLYIMNEKSYLTLDGENIVIKNEGKEVALQQQGIVKKQNRLPKVQKHFFFREKMLRAQNLVFVVLK